jgi:cysteine desulfurase
MRIGNTIYLDYAATTPVKSEVLQAAIPYLVESFGNPHSADHVMGWAAARATEDAAAKIAKLTGSDPDEVIFTSGATEANNLALLGIARRAASGPRRRILIGAIEHKCVLAVGRVLEAQLGYQVESLPVDREGRIDVGYLQSALADDVLLVSAMAVNNEIGTIQPIAEIGERAAAVGAVFHCDAAQAPCAIDLSSIARHADLIGLSGHKMYAPKGIGALIVRRDLQLRMEPLIYGGGQQNNLRSGTVPTPLCVAMGKAAELIAVNGPKQRQKVRKLRDRLLDRLRAFETEPRLNGAPGDECHPGIANVCFLGYSASELLGAMQPSLAASNGSACTSGIPEPSHVLRAIGLSADAAQASIRFSLGDGITDADIDEAVMLINAVLGRVARSERQWA